MTITQLHPSCQFVERNHTQTGGSPNLASPDKPFYIGAVGQAKRADWVRFMLQYFVENSILPQRTLLTGVIEERANQEALYVRIMCEAPSQTGVSYGDVLYVPVHVILEHSPSDAKTSEQTEATLAEKPPLADHEKFHEPSLGEPSGYGTSPERFEVSPQVGEPAGYGTKVGVR